MVQAKMPFLNRLLYAAGGSGFNLLERVLTTWLMYHYVPPTDGGTSPFVPAAVFGAIMFFGRVVDAVADPVVSIWTDNATFKRGRRWPFMFFGGVPLVLVTIAIFYPPVAGESVVNAIFLAVFLGLFFFFFTFYACPYLALIPALARTHKERVDLTTLQAVFILLGTALAMVGSGILIDKMGFHGMVWIMGAIGLFFLYLPVIAVNERRYSDVRPSTMGLWQSLSMTFKNKPFLTYLAGNASFWFGFNIITMGIPYYVTVLIGAGEAETTFFLGAAFGVCVLCFPFANAATKRWGKKAMMLFSLGCFVVLLPVIYFFNNPFIPVSPYTFGLITMALLGVPLSFLFIVPNAIVADVTDIDEQLTGMRRESMYFGAQGVVLKFVLALSSLSLGLLFQFFGNSPAQPLGVRLTGPFAAFFVLLGFLLFLRYPEKQKAIAAETDPDELTF